eukprot:COSAG06_NODE_238_length_19422_cov_16.417741_20_plen_242_part_00
MPPAIMQRHCRQTAHAALPASQAVSNERCSGSADCPAQLAPDCSLRLQRGCLRCRCAATTADLQGIIDRTAANGGGWAPLPCGFHATLALTLPSGVKIGSAHCHDYSPPFGVQVPVSPALTLGACAAGTQQHIVAVGNGTGQAISGIVFDHTNLTDPATRTSCAVTGGGGSHGFMLENNRFLNINMTSQGFSAIQMAGCSGCTIRGNYVPNSGGDALNFNRFDSEPHLPHPSLLLLCSCAK